MRFVVHVCTSYFLLNGNLKLISEDIYSYLFVIALWLDLRPVVDQKRMRH